MAMKEFEVPWLPYAETLVKPKTEEEDQIVYDLDFEAFEQLTASVFYFLSVSVYLSLYGTAVVDIFLVA